MPCAARLHPPPVPKSGEQLLGIPYPQQRQWPQCPRPSRLRCASKQRRQKPIRNLNMVSFSLQVALGGLEPHWPAIIGAPYARAIFPGDVCAQPGHSPATPRIGRPASGAGRADSRILVSASPASSRPQPFFTWLAYRAGEREFRIARFGLNRDSLSCQIPANCSPILSHLRANQNCLYYGHLLGSGGRRAPRWHISLRLSRKSP